MSIGKDRNTQMIKRNIIFITSKNTTNIIIKRNRVINSEKETIRIFHPLTRDRTINM